MTRHLLIVRHAKSSWDDPQLDDHDRPLAWRGQTVLARIRDHLADRDNPPDLVLCSTARRAVDTLAGVRPTLVTSTRVELAAELYLATAGGLIDRLRQIDADVRSAMVVGHNPGLHLLAVGLAATGDPEQLARLAAKLPTGAVATISFDGGWAELGRRAGRIDGFFTPRPPP